MTHKRGNRINARQAYAIAYVAAVASGESTANLDLIISCIQDDDGSNLTKYEIREAYEWLKARHCLEKGTGFQLPNEEPGTPTNGGRKNEIGS